MAEDKTIEQYSIEESFAALEETIHAMEASEVSLEDSFALYAKGMELIQHCQNGIDTIEAKVIKLREDGTGEEFTDVCNS